MPAPDEHQRDGNQRHISDMTGLVNGFHKDAGLNGQSNGISMSNGAAALKDRKASSPMMPAFMVSAPGKVILFGEHAVVHGKVCCPAAASHGASLEVPRS